MQTWRCHHASSDIRSLEVCTTTIDGRLEGRIAGRSTFWPPQLAANGFRQTIQTAFIERLNLTFRQGIAGLGRQTWALASEQHLLLHTEWFRLYYHLARPHESLREPTPGEKGKSRACTPEMAAGLTDRVLTVGDILRMPLIPAAA